MSTFGTSLLCLGACLPFGIISAAVFNGWRLKRQVDRDRELLQAIEREQAMRAAPLIARLRREVSAS